MAHYSDIDHCDSGHLLFPLYTDNTASEAGRIGPDICCKKREERLKGTGTNSYFRDLTIKSNDKIRDLYDFIRQMETDINQYIQNITAVTAEKERIGAELNITIQIQSSMLPCIFPPSPVKVSSILSQENSVMSMQDTKYRLSARKTKVLFVGDAPQFDDITMLCLDYKKKMEVDAQ